MDASKKQMMVMDAIGHFSLEHRVAGNVLYLSWWTHASRQFLTDSQF